MKEPKLRFKGFEGEWETTKYEEVFSLIGDTGHNVQKNEYCERGLYPVVDQSKEYIVGYADKVMPIDGSKGLIIFGDHTREIKYIDFPFCTGADGTRILKSEQSFDVRFMYYVCLSLDIPNTGYNRHFKYIKESIYNIPKTKAEQQSIASYFQHLDSLIQSTTKKIESLKQVKAASLQSMFPQEGETTPRVRFKGFEGEWEKVRASNVFKTFNEKNRPDLPVLSATQDRGMVTRESIGYNIFHDKSNEATYKHILPGQFIIHLRSFQGGFAHSSIEGIASPAYTIMEFKDKTRHFDLYWKYIFVSKEFIKRIELITYGIRDGRSISFEEFSEMYFTVPSYEEQKKIASYITTLDRQITLQTQRLEKLKQIKAACLDNMFV